MLWVSPCKNRPMRYAWVAIALFMTLDSAASGQVLYWGFIGGTALTRDSPGYALNAPADAYGNPAFNFARLPGSRSAILGGLLEVRLPRQFALEVNIMHRPMRAVNVSTILPASGPGVTTSDEFVAANTWEFPVMLKWNVPAALWQGRVRPFVEGGPAFRTSQDDRSVLPSQFGATAGAGVAFHFGRLRVAPTIRYTRWEKETLVYQTKADQVEFLTSVAWGTEPDLLHASGHRLSLGILGGLSALGEFYYPGTGVRERVGFLAGASGQLEVRKGLAVEADAIYKPLRNSLSVGQGFTTLTWDFPVLVKYHLPRAGRPWFVEAGPSFRAAGNTNGYNPSHFGVTAGGGAEIRKHGVLLSTALRYTRWLKDASTGNRLPGSVPGDYARTNVNALELICGVAF